MADEKNEGNIWLVATAVFAAIAILLFVGLMTSNSELVAVKTQPAQEHTDYNAVLCLPLPNETGMTNTFNYFCPDGKIARFEQIGVSIPTNGTDDAYRIGGN